MTLNEAYRILRRFQDWRTDKDKRTQHDIDISPRQLSVAIDAILESQNTGEPLVDCEKCCHYYYACRAKQIGECHSFEPEDEP